MNKLFIIIALLLVATDALAQQAQIKPKTPVLQGICYQNVIEMITKQNLDVNIAQQKIEQAKANYIRSFSPLMPSMRAQTSAERFNGGEIFYFNQPLNIQRTTLRPTLSFDYQLSLGGKPFWDIAANKNRYKGMEKAYDVTFQQTLYDISIKYFNWLRAFTAYKSSLQTLELAKKQYLLTKDRLEAGFGTKLDVLQSETQFADRESAVLDSEHNLMNTEAELVAALNIPPGEHIEPQKKEINPFQFYFGDINLPNLYNVAQKQRPDIIENEYLIREAKNQLKSAFAEMLPTVYFSSYVRKIGQDSNNLTNTRQGLVSLNFDLLRYMGVNAFSNVRETKAQLNIAILQKEKKLNNIYESITKSYNDYFLNIRKLGVARKKIDTAQKSYDIAMARLETGVGINLEVLKSQSDLAQAQSDYQAAIMNNNISQLRLIYEIGLLNPEILTKFINGEKPLERFISVNNQKAMSNTKRFPILSLPSAKKNGIAKIGKGIPIHK